MRRTPRSQRTFGEPGLESSAASNIEVNRVFVLGLAYNKLFSSRGIHRRETKTRAGIVRKSRYVEHSDFWTTLTPLHPIPWLPLGGKFAKCVTRVDERARG